ncbi:MAG: hypothetical protein HC935_09770 [Pseudanabaena sp. SU_2_4]|nr:hypothetical protein [Pseudanabaena sp. SU_2_4]
MMFDKVQCHALFTRDRVPIPKSLGAIESFDDLMARMQAINQWRVFIKLAHGSSASGVVAFTTNGARFQAITTVELVVADGEVKLYNSRRIRRYHDLHDIATIVDTLCRDRVRWKSGCPKQAWAIASSICGLWRSRDKLNMWLCAQAIVP